MILFSVIFLTIIQSSSTVKSTLVRVNNAIPAAGLLVFLNFTSSTNNDDIESNITTVIPTDQPVTWAMQQNYPSITNIALKWLFVGVGITGLVTNLFVIIVIATSRQMRQQPRNWYIFNQSVADCLSAILIITSITKSASTKLEGVGGFLICWLWMTYVTFNTTTIASEYILVAFTIEVYLAIARPVQHKVIFARPVITVSVVIVWLLSAIYSLCISAAVARVVNDLCYIGYYWLSSGRQVTISMVIVKNVIPISVYVTSYVLILRSLRRRVQVQSHQSDPYTNARVNVAITLLYTLVIHVIAWSGSQVQNVMSSFGYQLDASSICYQLLRLATYISGCINPFIYLLKYDRFRDAVKHMFRKTPHSISVKTNFKNHERIAMHVTVTTPNSLLK